MASTVRTPRLPPEVRRRELLDAALDVIYEDGFQAVTVEAVVRRAGVTRPVLYDLFGDLDGLLGALLEREEQAALAPLLVLMDEATDSGRAPEDLLAGGLEVFLHAVRANPRTWRLILVPPRGVLPGLRERIDASRRRVADQLAGLVEWGVGQRGGPEGLDYPLAARLLVAAGEDAARLTLLHPRRYPPERIALLAHDGLELVPASAAPSGAPPPRAIARAEPRPEPPQARRRMSRTDRREQLLDAALDILAESGFDALSMEAIARRAQVNRAVVYRSFANLQLLLVALLRREDARTRKTIDALVPRNLRDRRPAEILLDALATFLEAVLRHPQTYRVILLRPESAPPFLQKLVNRRRSEIARRLRPLVEIGKTEAAAEDLDVDLVARMLLSAGEELARLALDDPDFPPDRLIASTWRLLDMIPTA